MCSVPGRLLRRRVCFGGACSGEYAEGTVAVGVSLGGGGGTGPNKSDLGLDRLYE